MNLTCAVPDEMTYMYKVMAVSDKFGIDLNTSIEGLLIGDLLALYDLILNKYDLYECPLCGEVFKMETGYQPCGGCEGSYQ